MKKKNTFTLALVALVLMFSLASCAAPLQSGGWLVPVLLLGGAGFFGFKAYKNKGNNIGYILFTVICAAAAVITFYVMSKDLW